jgi:hypothetical protein
MDALEHSRRDWMERVLGTSFGDDWSSGEATARLNAIGQALKRLVAAKDPAVEVLAPLFKQAMSAQGQGTPDVATIESLETGLARLQSAARGRDAQSSNRRGIAYPMLLLRWRSAQQRALGALQQIGTAVLAMEQVRADPRFARVQQAVTGLPGVIPKLGTALEDLLDAGINAGTDATIAPQALRVVADYRTRLADATQLGAIERFAKKHVGELALLTELDGALGEIARSLQAA